MSHENARIRAEMRQMQKEAHAEARKREAASAAEEARRAVHVTRDRTYAEAVKTDRAEGDVDEPDNADDKMPGLAADADEGEESDDEEGQDAPQGPMPEMLWPLPSPPPPGSRRASGADHGARGQDQDHQDQDRQDQDHDQRQGGTQQYHIDAMMKMANSVKELAESITHQNAVARGREHSVRGFGGPPRAVDVRVPRPAHERARESIKSTPTLQTTGPRRSPGPAEGCCATR